MKVGSLRQATARVTLTSEMHHWVDAWPGVPRPIKSTRFLQENDVVMLLQKQSAVYRVISRYGLMWISESTLMKWSVKL